MRKNISTANINQPLVSLFDHVSEKPGRYDTEIHNTQAWLLTNRNNLLEILSTGLIKPASLYTKYYPDPGQFCPNSLPIFMHTPTSELVNLFLADDETLFPVLLELDLRAFSGLCQVIKEDYSIEEGQLQLFDSSTLCKVISGCLPSSCITSVIFRSHLEIKEFQLRKYDNVPEGLFPLDIKPELFQGDKSDSSLLIEAIKKTGSLIQKGPGDLTQIIDRLGGSLLMFSSLATRYQAFPLEALISCLCLFQNPQSDIKSIDIKGVSEKYPWILGLLSFFPEEYPVYLPVELKNEATETLKRLSYIPEEKIFQIAIKQLAWLPFENFSNESIVEDILNEFTRENSDTFLLNKYKELFASIRNVLIGELALDRYLEKYKLSEFPVSGAFLYFLLKNKPKNIILMVDSALNQQDGLLERAAAFSGVLYGRATIPVDCYPGQDLKKYIDYVITQHFNLILGRIKMKDLPGDFEIRENKSLQPERQELINAGKVLISRNLINTFTQSKTISQTKVKKGPQATSEDSNVNIPVKVSKRGAPRKTASVAEDEKDSAEKIQMSDRKIDFAKIKKQLLDADLLDRDRTETFIAVEICRLAGWNEIVSTVIPVNNADFLLEYRKERMEFRMPGFVTPLIRIKPEEFKKKLLILTEKQLEQFYLGGLKIYIDKLSLPG